jgi:uncharacterized membrane protein YphA (DoxX/SURF4 family)
MKIIRTLCRMLTGIVFIFSGFVKGVDPLGFTYKIQDYFEAFHVEFLSRLALPLAIIAIAAELMIGLNLLTGLRIRFTSWLLLLFMSFFTVLTFILAIFNPVSDCGCFGDAVKLTNWQTFLKNVVLFIPTIIIFVQRKQFKRAHESMVEWSLVSAFILMGLLLSVYCYRNLPLIDFRPYSIGTNIPDKMKIPNGMPLDEYKTVLVYEKDGIQKEFSTANYPWQDSTWKWKETRQELVKKGYEPPIHDFVITSAGGYDITQDILQDTGYIFMIVSYDLKKANYKALQMLNTAAKEGSKNGNRFVLLTSSSQDRIETYIETFRPAYDICTADPVTLKTVIRSNPGIVLIQHGTVLGIWSFRNFNYQSFQESSPLSASLNQMRHTIEAFRVLLIAAILLLAYCIFHKFNSKNTQ